MKVFTLKYAWGGFVFLLILLPMMGFSSLVVQGGFSTQVLEESTVQGRLYSLKGYPTYICRLEKISWVIHGKSLNLFPEDDREIIEDFSILGGASPDQIKIPHSQVFFKLQQFISHYRRAGRQSLDRVVTRYWLLKRSI